MDSTQIIGHIPAPPGTTVVQYNDGWHSEPLVAWAATGDGRLLPMLAATSPLFLYPVDEGDEDNASIVAVILPHGDYIPGPAYSSLLNDGQIASLRTTLARHGVPTNLLPDIS